MNKKKENRFKIAFYNKNIIYIFFRNSVCVFLRSKGTRTLTNNFINFKKKTCILRVLHHECGR